MDVQLQREPNNPHDNNAVSVWVEVPGFLGAKRKQIGYLKRSHAERIGTLLDVAEQFVPSLRENFLFWHSHLPEILMNG